MSVYFKEKLLDNLEFDNETSSFILGCESIPDTFSIPYIPKKESNELDSKKHDLFLLESYSLKAENDIFCVKENPNDTPIGWIFPLSALESNENKLANKPFFNEFRFLSYQKLLESNLELDVILTEKKSHIYLSDLFDEDLIILVISYDHYKTKKKFNLDHFLPSLANHGYFKKNKKDLIFKPPNKKIPDWYRKLNHIKIQEAQNDIIQTDYVINLYSKFLKSLDHHLIRFHLLYQIVEIHVTDLFNKDFANLLDEYKKDQLTKNNFINAINNARSEAVNVRKTFEKIKPNNDTFEKDNLINLKRDCKELLNQHGFEDKNEIGDLIYGIRNLIVHNYRSINSEQEDLLKEITFEFEILINCLLISGDS